MSDVSKRTESDLEAEFGHPGDIWAYLQARVQDEGIKQFSAVQPEWLELMWSLDAYRVAGIPPREMGNTNLDPGRRLAAVYRNKGNWFATLMAVLLQNQTSQPIRPRIKVQGMSQVHQIDVAWPAREVDVLVCAETKVTGAPAYGTTPARSAISDFANRRKELKFAATDLKLYRRDQDTQIEHWGVWREGTSPKTYFLWAARLRVTGARGDDRVDRLATEAQALVNSYLDGAGLVSWRVRPDNTGYEPVPLPASSSVSQLDDVLYRVATEIKKRVQPSGKPPAPIYATTKAVDTSALMPDVDSSDD
jgi:hypothetical protein